jgi:hypothetical protein
LSAETLQALLSIGLYFDKGTNNNNNNNSSKQLEQGNGLEEAGHSKKKQKSGYMGGKQYKQDAKFK